MSEQLIKKTPLYDAHVQLNARMTVFGGWNMPLYYSSIIEEHRAVRENVGLFDLSHMGEFDIRGALAEAFIQRVITNDCRKLYDDRVLYSPLCHPDGGVIDDLLVYRFGRERFMMVVNASNTNVDFEWIRQFCPAGVELKNISDDTALVAIQGPRAEELLQSMIDVDLSKLFYYHFFASVWENFPVIVSRTGYTGSDGFEVYISNLGARDLWRAIMVEGSRFDLKPAGLGARDTLRVEASLPLYGHELTRSINPLEAGLGWTIGWEKENFIGREPLLAQRAKPPAKKLFCFQMEGAGIPRQGYEIFARGEKAGWVTSGTVSPFTRKNIGMGYIRPEGMETGGTIEIDIRGKRHSARIVRKPFYRNVKTAPKTGGSA